MDININDFKVFVERVMTGKNQSGSLSPSEFNSATAQAVMMHYNAMFGLPEQYPLGKPVPKVGWQMTQDITDSLSQFLVSDYALPVSKYGVATLPADYMHKSAVRFAYYKNTGCDDPTDKKLVPQLVNVQVLRDNEVANRLTGGIAKPTLRYPVCSFRDETIQFYPTNLGTALLSYLRFPQTPVWGYTMVSGRPVYDPATSVNIEFNPQELPAIAMKMLSLLGINLREQELQGYAQLQSTQGV